MSIHGTSNNRNLGNVLAGNFTEFFPDGTLRSRGDATSWKDMVADLFGRNLNSASGKVDYDWDVNAIGFQSGGLITNVADRVQGNLELNHEFKVGSAITFKPHVHWFQEVTAGAVVDFELTVRWRLQSNGTGMTSAWTTMTLSALTDGVWDFTGEVDGFYNQITRFPDMILDCSISDTIQFQMARTDVLGGTMLVYFMDIHGEVDSLGSDEEIAKS